MSYSKTSTNISLHGSLHGSLLTARCSRRDGQKVHSEIDLNYYLANVDGVIRWTRPCERPGNLMATCVNLGFKNGDPDIIQYKAWKASEGRWVNNRVNLSTMLRNDDGVLKVNEPEWSLNYNPCRIGDYQMQRVCRIFFG